VRTRGISDDDGLLVAEHDDSPDGADHRTPSSQPSSTDRTAGTEHHVMDLTDEELGDIALAADPEPALPADAAPLDEVLGTTPAGLLPGWYMATPMPRAGVLRGWRRRVVWLVIAAFLTITAFGLCNTYGDLVLP